MVESTYKIKSERLPGIRVLKSICIISISHLTFEHQSPRSLKNPLKATSNTYMMNNITKVALVAVRNSLWTRTNVQIPFSFTTQCQKPTSLYRTLGPSLSVLSPNLSTQASESPSSTTRESIMAFLLESPIARSTTIRSVHYRMRSKAKMPSSLPLTNSISEHSFC